MLRALAFDMDGTVGDTVPLCVEAFKRAIADVSGRDASGEEIRSNFGPNEGGMLRVMVPDKAEEALSAYLRHYEALHDMCPKPFDGMADILADLRGKGYRLGMITGKGKDSAAITLRRFGVAKYFETVETGSLYSPMKDANLRKFTAALGLTPGETAYLGDAVSDIREARAARVRVFSAAWAATADVPGLAAAGPDRLFRTVAEFAAFTAGLPALAGRGETGFR